MKIAIFWNYLFDYRMPLRAASPSPRVELTLFHGGNVHPIDEAQLKCEDRQRRIEASRSGHWRGQLSVQLSIFRRECGGIFSKNGLML